MISYEPLFHTLIKKDLILDQLRTDGIISCVTIAKFKKHESITLTTVEKLCKYLDCSVEDIVEIKLDNTQDT